MPVIAIDISTIPKETKAALARELTATASEVTGIPAEKFIVLIKELDRDNIGVGGVLLSELLPPPENGAGEYRCWRHPAVRPLASPGEITYRKRKAPCILKGTAPHYPSSKLP